MSLEDLKKENREYMTWKSTFNGMETEHTITPEAMDRIDQITTTAYEAGVRDAMEERDRAREEERGY